MRACRSADRIAVFTLRSPGLGIHGLTDLHRGLLHLFHRRVDARGILSLECLAQTLEGALDRRAVFLRNVVLPEVLESALRLIQERIRAIAQLNFLGASAVIVGVLFGFLDHLVHLFLAEGRGRMNGDVLLFAAAQVFRGHVQNAVSVDVKGDVDLRHTTRRRRDTL